MEIISRSVPETLRIGARLAKQLRPGDIVCLFGELGSGKTVLTKGIAQGLGLNKERIISPSFVLIREYRSSKLPLYHFDLYRLKRETDILTLGYEEYLYADGVSVIEWADRLKKLLPREFLKVELSVKTRNLRLLKLTTIGKRWKTRVSL
jgi:tRNA threonylcarbamoyladenosine biosynthesis protein TsaE